MLRRGGRELASFLGLAVIDDQKPGPYMLVLLDESTSTPKWPVCPSLSWPGRLRLTAGYSLVELPGSW